MKMFICDWGKSSQGGRYGLIQADNIDDAFFTADAIGEPERITELRIPFDEDAGYCIEIDAPSEPYSGITFDELEWDNQY